jgi:hypothetical protein
MVMREYFIELIKKARTASPTEKLQIEADLALIVKELRKPFWGTTGVSSNGAPLCHRQTDDDYRSGAEHNRRQEQDVEVVQEYVLNAI